MKGNKFLAAALAASMVFSTVPATALNVFADSVSVEASNIQADSAVVAEVTGSKEDSVTANVIKKLLEDTDQAELTSSDGHLSTVVAAIQTKLSGSALHTYDSNNMPESVTNGMGNTPAVEDVTIDGTAVTETSTTKLDDAKSLSFKITYDDGQSYTISLTTSDSDALTDSTSGFTGVKAALDTYFTNTTFTRETGVTPTSAGLAKQISPDTSKQVYSALSSCTYAAKGGQLTVNSDGTYSGKIKVTKSGSTKTYTFSSATFTEVSATAITDAADKIKDNTYPNPSATAPHDNAAVLKKIEADLDAAAGTKLGVNLNSPTVVAPNTRNNQTGSFTVAIGGKNYTFALTKSSDQKISETEGALETAKGLGSASPASSLYVTTHKKTDAAVNLTDYTTVNKTATAADGSALSLAVQPLGATAFATGDEAAAAVQTYLEKALNDAGVADNGVTISVKSVNTVSGTPDANKVINGIVANDAVATSGTGKAYKLLVTASIKNDFYGYTSDGTTKDTDVNEEYNYLLTVNTGALEAQATKGITLDGATVNIDKNYSTTANDAGNVSGRTYYTYVELAPTFTPADANDTVTYTVSNSDGDVIISNASGAILNVNAATPATIANLYKLNDDTAVKVGSRNIGLAFTKAGTYTVTVKAADQTATATVTVNGNFTDVKNTSYYADPVAWGYAKKVVNGKTDATFGVGQNVTRAEFVTFLYRIAVAQDAKVAIADDDVKVNDTFSDVSNTAYYAKAVQWAAANNITVGKGTKTFDPNGVVTRAEAVTFIYRAKGQPDTGAAGSRDDATAQFTDVADHAYYRAAVTWGVNTANKGYSRSTYNSIVNNGQTWTDSANAVVSGTSTTTFNPTGATTREQAISFIARAFYGTL